MSILITAATAIEIAPFINHLRKKQFSPDETDVLISGIGLTATTYSLAKQVALKKPSCIIQAGIAGCFDKKIPLSSVLAVKQDTIADQCVAESKKLKTFFQLKLVPANGFPFSGGWLVNKNTQLLKQTGLKAVRSISVNQVTASKNYIEFYKKEFNPVTESMEGAALHYVCLKEKIPFIQLRAVSNYIGERNKKNWTMKDSVHNLNYELLNLVKKLAD